MYVQFSKTSPLKSGESRGKKSSGENRVKSCRVCGCHGFFGPETPSRQPLFETSDVQQLTYGVVTLRIFSGYF